MSLWPSWGAKGCYDGIFKRMISDIRALLWVVTVGGLALAAYCIRTDYAGTLP